PPTSGTGAGRPRCVARQRCMSTTVLNSPPSHPWSPSATSNTYPRHWPDKSEEILSMTRTDQDTWDLASGVGATATWVAACRALAGKQAGALIDDPLADPLVRAVGADFFIRVLDGEITDETGGLDADADPDVEFNLQRMVNMMAVRTRYFDDFFTDATAAGVRQVVILASGLDSRPYRLAWPEGTVVYEVDQPAVIEFKTAALSELGAQPTAERRTVAVDLRDDWLNAL